MDLTVRVPATGVYSAHHPSRSDVYAAPVALLIRENGASRWAFRGAAHPPGGTGRLL